MSTTLYGMPIYENPLLTELVNVARSPSRALRRWRQGKRATNPMQPRPATKVFVLNGNTLVMHPEMRNRLVRDLPAREPTAIGFDMATEPDWTVLSPVVRRPGKSVVGSASRLAEFMDHVMGREDVRLSPWQRSVVAAIERTPKPLVLPTIPPSVEAWLSALNSEAMASIERRILGLAHEPEEERVLDATTIRRLLDGDWNGKPERPATDQRGTRSEP